MNQFIFASAILIAMLTCIHEKNDGSSEPHQRNEQLFNQTEDLRQARLEWRKFWKEGQPSHLTPERIHDVFVKHPAESKSK